MERADTRILGRSEFGGLEGRQARCRVWGVKREGGGEMRLERLQLATEDTKVKSVLCGEGGF